jgi:hypothetical protein
MDYYLSKPIRESDLAGILDQIGRQGLIDRPVLIEESRLFGKDLMREIMEKYLEPGRSMFIISKKLRHR